MSKRPHEETKEERWQRKLKRYEEKLNKKRRLADSELEEEFEGFQEPEPEPWFGGYEEAGPSYAYTPVASPSPAITTVQDPKSPQEQAAQTEAPVTTDTQEDTSVPSLDVDPQLLEALGVFEEEKTEWGEAIVDQVAMRLKPLLLNGLKKEEKESLLKKFPFPNNLTLAKAPTLNAEVNAMLNEANRNRDKRLQYKQNQLGAALSGVTRAMSLLLCKEPKIVEILTILSDASKLLADSHYLETDTRKSLVTPLIDKELVETFKDRKRDEFLFGDKIGELVKNSRGIRKTGQLIKAPAATNLNFRGPSSRSRPHQSLKSYVSRGGGQQRLYRRRAAPSHPPSAPARRAPAPPRRPPPAAASQLQSGTQAASTTSDRGTGATH